MLIATRRQFLLGLTAASALVVVPTLPGLAWSDAVDLRVRCASIIRGTGYASSGFLPIEIIKMELEPGWDRPTLDVSALITRSDALEIGLMRGRHLRIRGLIGHDVWDAYRAHRWVRISIPCGPSWHYTADFAITDIRAVFMS